MEHEVMPRVRLEPLEVVFFPPTKENDKWRFDLIRDKVIIDTHTIDSPITSAEVTSLQLSFSRRIGQGLTSDAGKKVFALGEMVQRELHNLRKQGQEGIDKSVSTKYETSSYSPE